MNKSFGVIQQSALCRKIMLPAFRKAPLLLVAGCYGLISLVNSGFAQTCRDACYYSNTYQGVDALPSGNGDKSNTALGYIALNPEGAFTQNTAIGALTIAPGNLIIIGDSNTAVGATALEQSVAP